MCVLGEISALSVQRLYRGAVCAVINRVTEYMNNDSSIMNRGVS